MASRDVDAIDAFDGLLRQALNERTPITELARRLLVERTTAHPIAVVVDPEAAV
jgi:AmiR/NasT family two-component response regulator